MNPKLISTGLMTILLALGAIFQSAEAQGRRGRGNNQLPGALGRISRAQMGQLDRLIDDAMLYLSNKYDTQSLDVGNFFGNVVLKAPADDAINPTPPMEGQFGLYVLGSLNNAQIRMLSDLAREQIKGMASFQAMQKTLMAKFQELQKLERPSRTLEREMQTLGKEMGTTETNMGLAQAVVFNQLRETLTDDQQEYLMLLRRTPDAGSLDNPGVLKIRSLADKLEAKHRAMILALAERCCLYVTGAAPQNIATLGRHTLTDRDSEEAEKKRGFLNTLTQAQQAGLLALVGSHARASSDARTRRLQIAISFDTLKANKRLDERKLAAPGAAMGQADAAMFIGKLQGLEQLRASLSGAQRAFITGNILDGP